MAEEIAQSDAFQAATKESKQLNDKPTNDELLELYALYKVGTGADFAAAEKPGMFDLKGKAKYSAWKKVVEEDKLTPEAAQEKYVTLVETLKAKYGFDATKEPEAVGA
jgi:diazepam-binding inhibitor (GABA receptor modulating acyl-CoA-binding protein)